MDAMSIFILLAVSGWTVAAYAWVIVGTNRYEKGYWAGWNNRRELCRLAHCPGIDLEGKGDE